MTNLSKNDGNNGNGNAQDQAKLPQWKLGALAQELSKENYIESMLALGSDAPATRGDVADLGTLVRDSAKETQQMVAGGVGTINGHVTEIVGALGAKVDGVSEKLGQTLNHDDFAKGLEPLATGEQVNKLAEVLGRVDTNVRTVDSNMTTHVNKIDGAVATAKKEVLDHLEANKTELLGKMGDQGKSILPIIIVFAAALVILVFLGILGATRLGNLASVGSDVASIKDDIKLMKGDIEKTKNAVSADDGDVTVLKTLAGIGQVTRNAANDAAAARRALYRTNRKGAEVSVLRDLQRQVKTVGEDARDAANNSDRAASNSANVLNKLRSVSGTFSVPSGRGLVVTGR